MYEILRGRGVRDYKREHVICVDEIIRGKG